jgi:tetratricopeptide (TPR) repeat protein
MIRAIGLFVRVAGLLAILGPIYGCAHLVALQSDVLKQISLYEAEQEYGKALDVIAAVSASHPQRARLIQKRSQLQAKAKAFEQSTVKRADELSAQSRWGEAVALYRDAIDKIPQSGALRAAFQQLRQRQAQRVEQLNVDQLIGKARWVERALPVQVSIVNTDPGDWSARRALSRLREEAADVAQELTQIGLEALKNNDLGLAGRTLPIASRLSPDPVAARARDQLNSEEAAQVRVLRSLQERGLDQMREQESRKLLGDYRQAVRKGDLRRARLIMTRLQDFDGQNPAVVREGASLKSQLEAEVKRQMDEGNSLYGRGKFQEAMTTWSRVLDLEPENEQARASIERASRVVEKLKQLREQQAPDPKAAGL